MDEIGGSLINSSNEKLINDFRKKQEQNFYLDEFVLNTLNNFSHRYLTTQKEPVVTASKLEDNLYAAKSVEGSPEQALKDISDSGIQQKILEASPKSLLYGLCVKILPPNPTGHIQIVAFINWGHPDFPMASENMTEKTQVLEFSDPLELRHRLPQGLEQTCRIFI